MILQSKPNIRYSALIITWTALGLIFSGCSGVNTGPNPARDTIYKSTYQNVNYKRHEGSIWPGETSKNLLFADTKAKQIGDVVTVLIEENATSSQSATTDTSKETNLAFDTGSVLGLPANYLGLSNFFTGQPNFNLNVDATTSKSNTGTGTTSRNGSFKATIAAVITDVLPNGNFRILGRRSVTVNNEEQIMILTGIVRPVDIGFDNTISSTRIADAAITYTGKGIIADEQSVGWLTRLLSKIWPF